MISLKSPEQPVPDSAALNNNKEKEAFCSTVQETNGSAETTASIVERLLAQGLSMDDIIMPGSAKTMNIYVAADFDAPLDDFEGYV